jgi:hypothetical protein
MADPNPLAGMPLAESLANQMNESLQWMARMWGNSAALPIAGAESMFGGQSPLPPGLPSMLMPTFDPKELEKRINDLKTVEHWLDMNRALLHSTIQTLEMQRNAIVALQSMARPAQAAASASGGQLGSGAASEAAAQARGGTAAGAQPLAFDPTTRWYALQEQFVRVAAAAAAQPERPAPGPQPQRQGDAARPAPAAERPRPQPEAQSGSKPSGQ